MLPTKPQRNSAYTGPAVVITSETRYRYIPVRSVLNVPVREGLGINHHYRALVHLRPLLCAIDILLGASQIFRYAARMRELTDELLMRRYAKGDAQAFDQLYERHRGPLYRYFLRQVNDTTTANDLYQGAWEKIIKARLRYRPSAPFTAWMYRIAHNHLVDHYRRLRPNDPLEYDVVADHQPGPAQDSIDSEERDRLRSAIIALPNEQKNTLLLKLETGLKIEDIAQVTGVSRETVKSRLRYAVDKLRQDLL